MGFCWNDGKTNNWNYTIRYNKLAQTLSLLLPCLFSALCCSVVFMSFVLFRFILTFVSLPKWTASHWSALNFQWIEASSILYISIENSPLSLTLLSMLRFDCIFWMKSWRIQKNVLGIVLFLNFLQCDTASYWLLM